VRQGASWTAAYHLQLTVAAVARPIHSSVGAPESLRLNSPGCCSPDGVGPEERPAGIEGSGVVAVVDTASRHATASVAAVQHAVSTHPVSASGVRLSSRPVSGHLGWSSRESGARPSAVHPCGVQPSAVHPCGVQPSGVRPVRPDASVSSHAQAVAVGTRSRWPGDREDRNRWRPGGWRAVDGSIDGRGGQDAGDAAEVGLVRGRSVADPGRRVGCGPRRPRVPAERPGRPGRRVGAPVAGGCVVGTGAGGRARWLHPPRGGRPRAGCLTTLCGRRRAGRPGGRTWRAQGRCRRGMGVRPQRGPSRQRTRPARCRQRSDLRRWLVGLPGLEPGTSSLSGFCPRACFPRIAPATCTNDLPLETTGDRCEPLDSDGMWTKRGPSHGLLGGLTETARLDAVGVALDRVLSRRGSASDRPSSRGPLPCRLPVLP
jgi:hypothetical protein